MTKYNIQPLIDQHEKFKLKFEDLTIKDLFEWVRLKEAMLDMVTEMTSELAENKLLLDNEKGSKMIDLKWQLTAEWKKVHTDSTAQAVINEMFLERDKEMIEIKKNLTLLKQKADNIIEYVNLSKKYLDLDKDTQVAANKPYDFQ